MLYTIDMLHTRLVTIKRRAVQPEQEPIAVEHPTLKKSCKERVMKVLDPILTPIAQAVADHERQIKLLETKIEALATAFVNTQISDSTEVDLPVEDLQAPTFLLRFPTEADFKKAEPCLRSLSDLLEKQNIDFEILELSEEH